MLRKVVNVGLSASGEDAYLEYLKLISKNQRFCFMKKLPVYLLTFCLTLPIHARLEKGPAAGNSKAALALRHKSKLKSGKKGEPAMEAGARISSAGF